MRIYQAKAGKLEGTDFHEVRKKAFGLYQQIRSKIKRRPYVRSVYFKKDKVLLALFWQHLWDKHKWQDRILSQSQKKIQINLTNFFIVLLARHGEKSYFLCKSKRIRGLAKNTSFRYFPVNKKKDFPLGVVYKPRAESLFHLLYYINAKADATLFST